MSASTLPLSSSDANVKAVQSQINMRTNIDLHDILEAYMYMPGHMPELLSSVCLFRHQTFCYRTLGLVPETRIDKSRVRHAEAIKPST